MDKTEALLKHLRDLASWLEIQAREFDSGHLRPLPGAAEDSAEIAASYRHKLKNVMAVVQAYDRLQAKENNRGMARRG